MFENDQLSSTKQALLEKYLRGEQPKIKTNFEVIPRREATGTAPLSFGQQQIWLHAQLVPDVPLYNEPITVRLPGPLNVDALKQGLNAFIQRHAAWRTTFPLRDGQPIQLVHSSFELDIPYVDLRALSREEREATAVRLAQEQVMPLFDLTQLPLLRAMLVQLDDEDHRLYMALHHIIFDGYIYEVFLPELRTLYEASLSHTQSPLAPLPIQYTDFCFWQHEQLHGQDFAEQLAYWKRQLAYAPEALELPTDHPRSAIQSYHGAKQTFGLSSDFTATLKSFSRREGVSLYMLLLAVFKVLLYRYSGQDDILVGTTTAGRDRWETQTVMGIFLNVLALRTDLSGNPSFIELLGRVRDVVLEAHAHRMVPFEYVIKETQPTRNLTRNALIQVLFSLEPPLPVLPSGWTITLTDVEVPISKFDLYFNLDDRPDGFEAWIEYNSDIFDASTIQRMIGHWKMLLEQVVTDPTQSILSLPLLTGEEKVQLLQEWNATQRDYPGDRCLHQLFEEQVAQRPDKVAVVCADTSFTYRELNERANQLAHYLRQQGVGPDILVGIYMERSLDMLVALLGILKTGGAYVPLDPAYPQERLTYMLKDSQTQFLLTQQMLMNKLLPQGALKVVCLDTDWKIIAQEACIESQDMLSSDNLLYIIYTSGSSGRPKGVQITHRSVVNVLSAVQQMLPMASSDSMLGITTLSFDIAAVEFFLPLITGACLLLQKHDVIVDSVQLLEQITTTCPTVVQATPATWRMLLDAGLSTLSELKIISTGEALPGDVRDQLLARHPQSFWNLYGPSETTIFSTGCLLTSKSDALSIGRPIANTQIYVLDRMMQPVPIGVIGEIYIGGAGLARGYLNRPDLTNEKFVPNPFTDLPGDRLYRTGDLARYFPDGSIDFLGRTDHQVKLRGFRIELEEIEAVLKQYPDVKQAVVIARNDSLEDKYLAAYIVLKQGNNPSPSAIRQALKDVLPDYMIPSAFSFLDALPLTPNGKVDRLALPAPDMLKGTSAHIFAAPTKIVHYQLQQIWEEALHIQPIGIRDNFFELGGHSLLAARTAARIEQIFGKKIALSTLLANPTIEQLAEAMQKLNSTSNSSPVVAVRPYGLHKAFFFLHGDYVGGAFYCYPLAHALGEGQPFYTLDPYRFNGQAPAMTIEEVAADHIRSIRTVQPQGPYLLGGFCNGGLVAYEMARQLQAQGETPELLVLINPTPVGVQKWLRQTTNRLGKWLHLDTARQLYGFLLTQHTYCYLQHIYRYLRFPYYRALEKDLTPEDVQHRGGKVIAWKTLYEIHLGQESKGLRLTSWIAVKELFTPSQLSAIFPDAAFPPLATLSNDWTGSFIWAASSYNPGKYTGKSTFTFFNDTGKAGYRLQKRWLALARTLDKDVEVHVLPGTESTCKTKYLPELAACLQVCLHQLAER